MMPGYEPAAEWKDTLDRLRSAPPSTRRKTRTLVLEALNKIRSKKKEDGCFTPQSSPGISGEVEEWWDGSESTPSTTSGSEASRPTIGPVDYGFVESMATNPRTSRLLYHVHSSPKYWQDFEV